MESCDGTQFFSDKGNFDKEKWQLFHVDEDRAEANDVQYKYPDMVTELSGLWLEEAKKYNVLLH
jgi:arylsulfatase